MLALELLRQTGETMASREPVTAKESTEGANAHLRFGVSCMQGWRSKMEDAHVTTLQLDSNTSCFGVFDGHNGKEVAVFVSLHFTQELIKNEKYQRGDIENALKETYMQMDRLIRGQEAEIELFRAKHDLFESTLVRPEDALGAGEEVGCTAVVAVLRGNVLYVANAGDSRCVLGRGGRAVDLSTDHKPTLPEEMARIQAAGGTIFEGRVNGNINLSRSLGDLTYKNVPNLPPDQQILISLPDVRRVELTPEDNFIVLCCDGIWDILTSQQCVDFIYERLSTKPLKTIAEEICDRCLASSPIQPEGRGCDNMTVVLVAFAHPS